jgi:hypothetical protein
MVRSCCRKRKTDTPRGKEISEHFSYLPKTYIIDGEWEGNFAARPRCVSLPRQAGAFANTRCGFAEADGKCGLQTLAVKLGKHKWAFKPMGCWLFPLESENGKLVPPPRTHREDPNNLGKRYPGFTTYTPCGQHDARGKVGSR